jgi:hypothetical protein
VPSCVWIRHTSAAFRIHLKCSLERPSLSGSSCKFIPGLLLRSSWFDRRSLCRATFAQRAVLRSVTNSFHRPYFSSVRAFLKGFLYRNGILHGGTPFCRRQPTSSWIHYFPGSFPSFSGGTSRPDSGPYAASSVPTGISTVCPLGTS